MYTLLQVAEKGYLDTRVSVACEYFDLEDVACVLMPPAKKHLEVIPVYHQVIR